MAKQPKAKAEFLAKLVTVFEQNLKCERVTIPLMKTVEQLLESDYLSGAQIAEELIKIHALSVQECNKSKNIVKLMASIGVFSNMLTQGGGHQELTVRALRSLLCLLYHSFPKVRRHAAEKLYNALLTLEDEAISTVVPGGEEMSEAAQEMLSETDWTKSVKELTVETRDKMYAIFGQEPKVVAKKE